MNQGKSGFYWVIVTNHFQWVGIDTTSIQKVLDIYRGLSNKSSISRDFYLKHAKRKEVEMSLW